jgi:hypothetical protein
MGQRLVRGSVRKPDSAWGGVRIVFTLLSNSFSSSAQYPVSAAIVEADEHGDFSVSLWANEEGEIPSRYSCRIDETETFEFTVPVGVGELQLSLLREAGIVTPGSSQWRSILAEVDRKIAELGVFGGLPWISLSVSGTLEPNKAYSIGGNTMTLLALPEVQQQGDRITVFNNAPSNFRITQGNGQSIKVGNQSTTSGVTGKIESRSIGDWIELTYLSAIGWICTGINGNLEIV